MFFTLLERFLYVHGRSLLLWWKTTSCLSSLYFSLASKWNQAAASPALLLLKFFTLQLFVLMYSMFCLSVKSLSQ